MEENMNTNPVPTIPVENQPTETVTTPVETQPAETGANTNPVPTTVAEGQPVATPTNPPQPETSTTTETTTTEQPTETTTETTANTSTETSTNTSTEKTSPGESISNTATGPSQRTSTEQGMKIAEDGTISIDGKVATNEQLEKYFDYTNYSDKNAAKMVEGIFKSDTVTINGVTYKAELNANGEMVSVDGTKKLTQEEIKSYFGDKGYEALVCKTTKDVSIDENGKLSIKDREEPFKIRISQPSDKITPNVAMNNSSSKDKVKDSIQPKIKSPTKGGSSGGGGGGGYSGGGGGGYSGGGGSSGGGSNGGSNGGSDTPNPEEVEEAGTPIIMVEFGQLEGIRDEIQTLKTQLKGVCDDYGNTINGLSGNGDAWTGVDKDAYISQKKGYVTNIGQVSATLDQFASYLDTCVNNYKELESKLAAKEIS